jgi:hypothetical protein
MDDLHVGERVTFQDRVYIVRGISPLSAVPCRVHLEDVETGEEVQADADHQFQAEMPVKRTRNECAETGLRSVSYSETSRSQQAAMAR